MEKDERQVLEPLKLYLSHQFCTFYPKSGINECLMRECQSQYEHLATKTE